MKYFSLIESGEIHAEGEEKVIPAGEFETLMEAAEVLEKTKKDVKTYLSANKEKCKEILEKSEEAGFNKGLTEFNKQILQFEHKLKELEHELQKMVLPLALKAAKKIVGRELKTDPGTIVDIVRKTLKPVMQSHRITIFVNKQDKEILDAEKGDLKKILEHVKTFKIEQRSDVFSHPTSLLFLTVVQICTHRD